MVAKSKGMTNGSCNCPCHSHKVKKLFIGGFLVVFGLVFLLNKLNYTSDSFTNLAWPVLLVLLGIVFVGKGCCKCCSK